MNNWFLLKVYNNNNNKKTEWNARSYSGRIVWLWQLSCHKESSSISHRKIFPHRDIGMLSGCLVGEGAQIWFPWQVCVSVCTGRYPGFGTSPKACHNFSSWCVDGNQDLILFVPHWHTCSAVQLHLAKNARGGNSLNTVVTVLTALCCVWLFLWCLITVEGFGGYGMSL